MHTPQPAIRFITATSLFDGHDAAINIMRRILQASGAEVIHLGHNRSVEEIVTAALQEDVQGIAISAYQGGHMEFFQYMIDLLRARGGENIHVFGGGGGVIVPEEISALHEYGVSRIFSPEDGQKMGLQGMIDEIIALSPIKAPILPENTLDLLKSGDFRVLARLITALENGTVAPALHKAVLAHAKQCKVPVLGITGTGGSGKSSLTDELVRRFRLDQQDQLRIAILAVDPSRRKTGGALLGDRIRMNAVTGPQLYMRSLATRTTDREIPEALSDMIAACRCAGFDLVIVETPGIGQGNAAIVPLVDRSLYVMTPEFGAASQLEKIDMLDFADAIVINKFDRKGAEDALRDVRKQVQRNRQAFHMALESMPVYGTIAARFNDDGVTALYQHLVVLLKENGLKVSQSHLPVVQTKTPTGMTVIVPTARTRYLAEIAETVRGYHHRADVQVAKMRERQQLAATQTLLERAGCATTDVTTLLAAVDTQIDPAARRLMQEWPEITARYSGDAQCITVSTTGTRIPKVALPRTTDHGELLRWLLRENLPGYFPYTAGVFAFKREHEDPTRMFAGEGDPFRTNRRFKQLSEHAQATRLSTAFDSVTLYGCDPDERPDIYGKVGNSGVSIATLDDMQVLYSGFDVCAPSTSVSMTINGPAPILLAMYFNTAFAQQRDQFAQAHDRLPTEGEMQTIQQWVLENIRGTVQADILKEDQGQNTCIFSTEFALKMMGDIQEYFVQQNVRNFYSVSISGYHIAEAGANPISQLAFTLANGFTYVETYLARGMHIDDFAPNLSFFFSNGMEPEYSVIGRVARRIWATAMRDKYGANARSQKLKYHIQTSGRSLHAQEMDFNDIRTTLQALIAIYDNCNSLHTNAYDEAITTPTEESSRRALAIQLIINREWGLAKNENPNQGAFIIDELTDLVEEAVLQEFERISERGGVLGAMETGYQRGKIQEESLHYETLKHTGALPLIGVNTFRNPKTVQEQVPIALARSTEEEKQSQLQRLRAFQHRNGETSGPALDRLKQAAMANQNLFSVLIDAVRYCSLGQMTAALFEVGGQYRRNM